ncbi:DegV family protein [Clostridium sp. P21]|uniref:DegV family protein n=1 Tax=Clostridium muellerianum TaxID=2716538 RepID=A0A7Y0HN76_9CLOT|nr:DegV family protein [Clostridium muellerianum]NMM61323.1 DegV family protein [Clostridium muellerianum]
MKLIIMTDASCDLPPDFIDENEVPFLGLTCCFKGKEYEDDFGKSLGREEFYKGLKEGEMPSTSQINEFRFVEKFKELLKQKVPIIYIGMSSGLSGTFNSAKLAREIIMEEYKDADITLIDTRCSSIGQGILVYNAYKMIKENFLKEDIINWIENTKTKVNHWFVVEDLKHLKRGGRISVSKAAIGTLLDIKPIICITEDGTLKNVDSIRGRKRAIKYLIEKLKEQCENPSEQLIGIAHGDCLEDARALKKVIENQFKTKNVILSELGLGMASHCGRGMLALCFIGKER